MVEMPKESIQLMNVKVAHHMSEETTAFTATLYINGKKAAYVKNWGTGGDTYPRFMDRELEMEFYEFCKSLPDQDFGNGETYPMDVDGFLDNLLSEWLENDDWKKICRKGIAYTLTSHKEGEYMLWKTPYTSAMAEQVRKQYSETGNLKEIINERFI